MIVHKGKAMLVDSAGKVTWSQLPTDPRQKQAVRYQLEAAQYSTWVVQALSDMVGLDKFDEIQAERFSLIPHYQQMAAMYSALAMDKMS